MKSKRLKCYIYIRVSTAMQVDGYSLEAQNDRLTKYAEFQGMEVVKVYCDAGKSGKNITGRPEFTQMLHDVADGKDSVDYILVFKLSRFGRNAADVLNSLQYIQDFGVNLICVEDGIDSSKDSGKLTITVLSAVAEIERENILVQTMEGRKQKAREGKWNKTHSLEHEHILSGIIKCPICGHGLSGTVRRRKNNKTVDYVDDFYYRCQHRHKIDDEHFCNFQPSLNQNDFNHEVEQVILDMVNHENFRQFVMDKVNTKVDVSALEEERERIRKLLRQVMGAKTKLTDMLDKLDVMDKHYDRKYQDKHDRLDNLYDKISEYEDSIADITARIEAVYGNQITGKQIYDILVHFEMMYYKMTDLEKKEFMKDFINSIELYPEKMDNGSIVKQINFKFGVYYEGQETMDIRLLNEKTVETVTLLKKK